MDGLADVFALGVVGQPFVVVAASVVSRFPALVGAGGGFFLGGFGGGCLGRVQRPGGLGFEVGL